MDYKNCCRFLYLLKTDAFFEWDYRKTRPKRAANRGLLKYIAFTVKNCVLCT